MSTPQIRTLERALEAFGTKAELAKALGLSVAELEASLTGAKPLPSHSYVMALNIVAKGRARE